MKTKILIVDDEPGLTRMIKLNLELTGRFEVRTENRGKMAIQVAHEFDPDIIFLDIMMPDIPGDAIAEQLKLDEKLSTIKLVFLTAMVTRDDTADGHNRIGGHEFLAKPVSTKDLLRTIAKLLPES
ncbi:MAG: response regulator [Geopsychrobacter sp.]|nr:response regulator [Geopsychrobacter sp.]